MKSCTFFGHRDTPSEIKPHLKSTLIDLIENYDVAMFYMGSEGSFDAMALSVVRELKLVYPHIDYVVVLAYLPKNPNQDYTHTIYPEEVAKSHPRYAISKRNRYMIEKSGFVIYYVKYSFGGAYKIYSLANKKRQGDN